MAEAGFPSLHFELFPHHFTVLCPHPGMLAQGGVPSSTPLSWLPLTLLPGPLPFGTQASDLSAGFPTHHAAQLTSTFSFVFLQGKAEEKLGIVKCQCGQAAKQLRGDYFKPKPSSGSAFTEQLPAPLPPKPLPGQPGFLSHRPGPTA